MFFGIRKLKKTYLHAPTAISKALNKCYCFIFRSYVRRTFLFSSSDGSLTLEAAIVLPVYIFFLASMIYILNILDLENTLQAAMEEASRSVNSYAYMAEKFDDLTAFDKTLVITGNHNLADILIDNIVNNALVRKTFMTDQVKDIADNSYILNGADGIRIILAASGSTSHFIDFNIEYYVKLPFFPDKLVNLRVHQRCYFRTFTGEDIRSKTGDYTQYVYTTPTGGAYHTSPYCSYLSKYYSILPSSYFEDNLNSSDLYQPCSHCAKNAAPTPNSFICAGSRVYHNRIDCFYLNANIYKVTLESVKDTMHLCPRCRKGVN